MWPLESHQDASLEDLAIDARANEEMFGEIVLSALDELAYRGHSEDEVFRFVTWGS